MLLADKIKEIIDLLSVHYEFKIMDNKELDNDECEVSFEFVDIDVNIDDIKQTLVTIKHTYCHVIKHSDIVVIRVDVNDLHIA